MNRARSPSRRRASACTMPQRAPRICRPIRSAGFFRNLSQKNGGKKTGSDPVSFLVSFLSGGKKRGLTPFFFSGAGRRGTPKLGDARSWLLGLRRCGDFETVDGPVLFALVEPSA